MALPGLILSLGLLRVLSILSHATNRLQELSSTLPELMESIKYTQLFLETLQVCTTQQRISKVSQLSQLVVC